MSGQHRMSFRNFTTGGSHSFGGSYLELIPGKRLVYTDRFDDQHQLADLVGMPRGKDRRRHRAKRMTDDIRLSDVLFRHEAVEVVAEIHDRVAAVGRGRTTIRVGKIRLDVFYE